MYYVSKYSGFAKYKTLRRPECGSFVIYVFPPSSTIFCFYDLNNFNVYYIACFFNVFASHILTVTPSFERHKNKSAIPRTSLPSNNTSSDSIFGFKYLSSKYRVSIKISLFYLEGLLYLIWTYYGSPFSSLIIPSILSYISYYFEGGNITIPQSFN